MSKSDPNERATPEAEAPKKREFELQIREMEIDDLPAVFHLGERIFTSETVPTLYRTWDEFEVTSLFNSDPEFCLVAEVDGETVGFILGTTVTKTKSAWKYGYVVWLAVVPEWQREGLGSRLFDKLAEKMIEDGVRIFMVDTEATNQPALSFFKKKGFANPEEQIYLTLNVKTYQEKPHRGRTPRRKQKNGSET
ncbi:MAG: GNAT family N-acetyltransferase [Dehalococcoidia bacterium]|nr:GNAT family N-acetyltransferase [Dehalococcoidia bacterium]